MDLVTLIALCGIRGATVPCTRYDHDVVPPMLIVVADSHASASSSEGHDDPSNPPSAIDRWQPYIVEASRRFGILEQWIRAVMRAESGGHAILDGQPITSHAGAMGLMQVMPETYAAMRRRLGLGADPYDPHDNVLAGVAYLRDMYDRYGYPGFFAAYNAGPDRFDAYLLQGHSLPDETWNYLTSIGSDVVQIVRTQSVGGSQSTFANTPSSTSKQITESSGTTLFFKLGTDIMTPVQPFTDKSPDPRAGLLFVPLGRGDDAVRRAGEDRE